MHRAGSGAERASSTGSLGLDLKAWQVEFGDLELVRLVGEGSYGRVSRVGQRACPLSHRLAVLG